ncbi:MAG TPA: hypothetical protein VNW25_02980 [Candidatus Sulfotelmatobacter sp.]|nr:hypothetical protein [Candidatus Sulfotelmatobacter sp.]
MTAVSSLFKRPRRVFSRFLGPEISGRNHSIRTIDLCFYAAGRMLRITAQVTNLAGERFRVQESQLPPQVQIAININIVGLEIKSESTVHAKFVVRVNYNPSIA